MIIVLLSIIYEIYIISVPVGYVGQQIYRVYLYQQEGCKVDQ